MVYETDDLASSVTVALIMAGVSVIGIYCAPSPSKITSVKRTSVPSV